MLFHDGFFFLAGFGFSAGLDGPGIVAGVEFGAGCVVAGEALVGDVVGVVVADPDRLVAALGAGIKASAYESRLIVARYPWAPLSSVPAGTRNSWNVPKDGWSTV